MEGQKSTRAQEHKSTRGQSHKATKSQGRKLSIILFALVMAISSVVEAKVSEEFKAAFEERFKPALSHKGLETAAAELEIDKLKTFVVVEKGGLIPAERAYYFASPGEYDYRGVIIDGDRVKTRIGGIYVKLARGAIMAVAGVVYFGRKVYLKLISLEKIRSIKKPKLKPTRVTVMLGFKFDKSVINNNEFDKVFPVIEEWVKPFGTYEEARKYSESILLAPDQ